MNLSVCLIIDEIFESLEGMHTHINLNGHSLPMRMNTTHPYLMCAAVQVHLFVISQCDLSAGLLKKFIDEGMVYGCIRKIIKRELQEEMSDEYSLHVIKSYSLLVLTDSVFIIVKDMQISRFTVMSKLLQCVTRK